MRQLAVMNCMDMGGTAGFNRMRLHHHAHAERQASDGKSQKKQHQPLAHQPDVILHCGWFKGSIVALRSLAALCAFG